MAIYTRRPKNISPNSRYTKLFFNDDKYVLDIVKAKSYESPCDAIRDLVNEAIRVRQAKERGKDETLYAVVKKQEMVVHEGTKHLAESVKNIGQQVSESLTQHDLNINELTDRLAILERHVARQNRAVNRLLEISVICYGILRHYVLGLFVVRLTKQSFQSYSEGFSKRLNIFRKSVMAGNLLLEGDYEQIAADFAQGLEAASTVAMPASNEEQSAAQKDAMPLTGGNALTIPQAFPQD